VIMCDVDHFKQINDEKGHAAGDDVLQLFVSRMQKAIRSNSDWVARYGGEEFLLVMPETEHQAAMFVAEKIRALIGGPLFSTRSGDIRVTSSFGVASTGPAGPDLAMKVGKPHQGRGSMPVSQQGSGPGPHHGGGDSELAGDQP
jgi:diguanylate cyclase (GGDEF)-like protein